MAVRRIYLSTESAGSGDGKTWANRDRLFSSLPNLLRYSEDFTNALWTGTAVVASNAVNDPNGNPTIDTLTDNSASVAMFKAQSINVSGGVNYCFSFLLAKDATTSRFPEIGMDFVNVVGTKQHRQFVNTSTGATLVRSGFNNGTISVTSFDSNFWLVEMVTQSSTDSFFLTVTIWPASASTIGTATNAATGSINVGWAQLNEGTSRGTYQRVVTGIEPQNLDLNPIILDHPWVDRKDSLECLVGPGDYTSCSEWTFSRNRFLFSEDSANATWTKTNTTTVSQGRGANLLTYSDEYQGWTGASGLLQFNTHTGPSDPTGELAADSVFKTAASVQSISRNVNLQTGAAHTISLWIRAGTKNTAAFGLFNGTSFVAVTGSIISGPGSISGTNLQQITGLTSDWTRVQITLTPTVTLNTIFIYPVTSVAGSASDFGSIVISGMQVELGSSATTYVQVKGGDYKLVPTTTSGQHRITQSVNMGSPHTISIEAKADGYDFISFGYGASFGGQTIYYNLSTGVITGSAANYSGTITAVGSGWYRCTFTFNSIAAAANLAHSIIVRNSAANVDYSGNGTSGVLIRNTQLDFGIEASPYQRTIDVIQAPNRNGTLSFIACDNSGVPWTPPNPEWNSCQPAWNTVGMPSIKWNFPIALANTFIDFYGFIFESTAVTYLAGMKKNWCVCSSKHNGLGYIHQSAVATNCVFDYRIGHPSNNACWSSDCYNVRFIGSGAATTGYLALINSPTKCCFINTAYWNNGNTASWMRALQNTFVRTLTPGSSIAMWNASSMSTAGTVEKISKNLIHGYGNGYSSTLALPPQPSQPIEDCLFNSCTNAATGNPSWDTLGRNIISAVSPEELFVDYAGGDYRIINSSPYWGKGIGAGDGPAPPQPNLNGGFIN
jgi:hypothetical protein